MAKPKSEKPERILVHVQIELDRENLEKLVASMPGNAGEVEKITAISKGTLDTLAEGGVLLQPIIVRQITDLIGTELEPDTLPELIGEAVNRPGGQLGGRWTMDPVHEAALKEMAYMQGVSIEDYVNTMITEFFDSEAVWQMDPPPSRVLMSVEDKAVLEDVLGEKFSTGTQLSELIKKALGATSPFAGV